MRRSSFRTLTVPCAIAAPPRHARAKLSAAKSQLGSDSITAFTGSARRFR